MTDMKDLATRLIEHQWWLDRRTDGIRADFSYEDHESINLSNRNLSGMTFYGACLRNANLSNCTMGTAEFTDANLQGADLSGSDLDGADFTRCNMRNADLRGVRIGDAYFIDAYLRDAVIDSLSYTQVVLRGATGI